MNSKLVNTVLVIALPVALAGCWNANRAYNKLMVQGQQRNVPLMIYDTSWNSGGWASTYKKIELAVGLVNTGDSPIGSVELYVAVCPLHANVPNTHRISLTGPFLPGQSYIAPYMPPAGSAFPGTSGPTGPNQRPLVIQAIGVTHVGGTEVMYRDNVASLLAPNISNYCPRINQDNWP